MAETSDRTVGRRTISIAEEAMTSGNFHGLLDGIGVLGCVGGIGPGTFALGLGARVGDWVAAYLYLQGERDPN